MTYCPTYTKLVSVTFLLNASPPKLLKTNFLDGFINASSPRRYHFLLSFDLLVKIVIKFSSAWKEQHQNLSSKQDHVFRH